MSHLTLGDTLTPLIHRLAECGPNRNRLWRMGMHNRLGDATRTIADPTDFPLWSLPVKPGSTHDATTAREHCLGVCRPAAAAGLPPRADRTTKELAGYAPRS